ncbi:DsrE family protein [Halosimplex aquaticum]|uniref:DsrE family protein n=1 Tax=Halosimplex aquaticum TaxID=3026162 RepID=A0ABD5XXM3_9EURY|nr:DsrE family protein [Halosimplex aquaticum]
MKAVFHHSDADKHSQVLGNVENLLDDDTLDLESVALVANSGGLGLLTRDSDHRDGVEALQERGVDFKQCENTLEGTDVTPDDLLDGVELVSSGVGELTRLQSGGYAYIVP